MKIIISLFVILLLPTLLTAQNNESFFANKSYFETFLTGIVASFGAFIMPCIYAMVPSTIGFFVKKSGSKLQARKNGIFYGLSIIAIFSLIGLCISLIGSGKWIYDLSSGVPFNLFVFGLLMVFGISFLGAFEINLPPALSNFTSSKSNLNSYTGIFFMALTLVVVSFSCIGGFIGTALVALSTSNSFAKPIIAFAGFGTGIALPFTLLAIFPALLNNLSKSGGWLNTVKVSFGFLEIALALKFLSNADMVANWRILDYDVFLCLWIIIFALWGFYLLGKLRFKHDDELPLNDYGKPYISVGRLFWVIAVFSFVIYMIPGLWGAPLKGISGWLPTQKHLDFNLNKNNQSSNTIINESISNATTSQNQIIDIPKKNQIITTQIELIQPKKFINVLESELPNVRTFFDYDEALAAAKKEGKNILIDFTGHTCVNCRKMETAVLKEKSISDSINKNFIFLSLYADDKTELPAAEHFISKLDGSKVNTIAKKTQDFQFTKFNSFAQPAYYFVDANGKLLKDAGGYNADIERFARILDDVSKIK